MTIARSPNIGLRPLEPRDIEIMVAWSRDDEFCRAAEWTVGLAESAMHSHCLEIVHRPSPELLRMAVTSHDRIVGYADLFGTSGTSRELGILIGERAAWGQGSGRTGAALMLAHGFDTLGLHTITAEAWNTNLRSIRLLQSLGMQETGRGEDGIYREQPAFYRQFAITRDAWPGCAPQYLP